MECIEKSDKCLSCKTNLNRKYDDLQFKCICQDRFFEELNIEGCKECNKTCKTCSNSESCDTCDETLNRIFNPENK